MSFIYFPSHSVNGTGDDSGEMMTKLTSNLFSLHFYWQIRQFVFKDMNLYSSKHKLCLVHFPAQGWEIPNKGKPPEFGNYGRIKLQKLAGKEVYASKKLMYLLHHSFSMLHFVFLALSDVA